MTEKEQPEQQRVSKREFLAQVSTRSRIPAKTVNRVYDTILAELLDIMTRGDQLMLTGFGKFYPQAHKGHRVQFADNGAKAIDDYFVLKFSATRSVNKSLVQKPSDAQAEVTGDFAEEDSELVDQDAVTDQDALFETAAPAAKAKAAPRTTAPKVRKPTSATASLAAAATQSSRAINRAKRQAVGQVVKESTSDRAI
ncbi:UNVERIFIED_ORG: nucleoid DNA-binding protein [Arthrobacter sp. UYCu721]